MKRSVNELNIAPSNKKAQAKPAVIETAAQLAQAVGLSLFMLHVLGDLYDARTGKFSAAPRLIDYKHNAALRSFGPVALERYRAAHASTKKLSNEDVVHAMLKQEEQALQKLVVQLAGAADQEGKMPARERDALMVTKLLSYARTEGNYYCYVYYVGPEDGDVARHQALPENWALVPKGLLSHFHRRIRHLGEYQQYSSNDCRALSRAQESAPAFDPRFIVLRWKKAKENATHLALVMQHIDLLRRPEDPVLTRLRAEHSDAPQKRFCAQRDDIQVAIAPAFDVARDREEQAARGFVLHDHPRLGRISMAEFPDLARWPVTRDLHFSLDDLVYLAQRLGSADRWDPLVLVRALVIALNPEAHVKRTMSVVSDSLLQILERDDVVPIVERLLGDYGATRAIKDATLEYVLALMAVDLVTREDLPPHLKAKIDTPGPHDFVMIEQ